VTEPLIFCERPRLIDSEFALGSFEAHGQRLVLVGAWGPFFRLLGAQLALGAGSVRILGIDARDAVASGKVGLMLADAPLPPAWTLREVLRHGAGLLGLSWRVAAERAAAAAGELGLAELLPKVLSRLDAAERRAAGIAFASLGEPLALALEDPLGGLEPSGQRYVAAVLERAIAARPVLLSVAEVPGSAVEDAFVQASDELLFLGAPGLVARGTPLELMAAATTYRIVVLRHADVLLNRLSEAGYEVRRVMADEMAALVVRDVLARGTEPLLEAALSADAPLVELVPLTLRPAELGATRGVAREG